MKKGRVKRDRVKRVIEFIECLTVPSGKGQGKPFKLLPFQKKFIRDVYGPHVRSRRQVRRAILSMARKNGKSTFIAALALVHLCGPECIMNGEIFSAANEREQAAIIFKIIFQIVRGTPALASVLDIIPSKKRIVHYDSGSIYQALSREASSKFGANPTFIIYDELSQAKSEDLYDALDTSMGGREEPLSIIISTQSHDPEHLLSKLIDDGLSAEDPTVVAHLYATPEKEEINGKETEVDFYDESAWLASNPALNKFRDLEDLRSQARKAKRMPSREAAFRNLCLNQRIDSRTPFIARAEWLACAGEQSIEPGEPVFLGLDLSSTIDLCALAAVSAEDGDRAAAWFWKPGDLLVDHERRDRVPYKLWADQGFIDAPKGRAIDYGYVAQQIAELSMEYTVLGLAYDRWRIENLLREFNEDVGIDAYVDGKDEIEKGLRLVPWGQGFKDMAPACDALEQAIMGRSFQHTSNPVLTWCFSNAIAITDPAGNRKLDKSKSRYRIDGAVAITMAIGLKDRDSQEDEGPSVYEARGLVVL